MPLSFDVIFSWLHAVLFLAMAIFCLVAIRHRAGMLLGIGLLMSIMPFFIHKILFMTGAYQSETRELIFAFVTLVRYAAMIIIFLAILQLATLFSAVGVPQQQTVNVDPNAAPGHEFGLIRYYFILLCTSLVFMPMGVGFMASPRHEDIGIMFLVVGILAALAASVYLLLMLYKVWRFVIFHCQLNNIACPVDSAGKAVGFLFIPFFNFYWGFIAYGKLPESINMLLRVRGQQAVMSEGLGVSIAVVSILSVIPYLGVIASFAAAGVMLPLMLQQASQVLQSFDLETGEAVDALT